MTASSGVAVDNLGDKLVKAGVRVVRLGHPARISESLHSFSLSVLIKEERDNFEEVKIQVEELREKLHSKWTKLGPSDRRFEEDQLNALIRQRDDSLTKIERLSSIFILEAHVVLATLTGCKRRGPLKYLPDNYFNTTVIDECGQALEMACWIGIHKSPKLILAGDHHQLAPTVISKKKNVKEKLSVSLMERLGERFSDGTVIHMLKVGFDYIIS